MKLSNVFTLSLPFIVAGQTPAPYTDPKSGITFNAYITPNYFFGLALPDNGTSTDFIGTIGGSGTGWSGVSLGGAMRNKLLILSWPNGQSVVSSFRKTAQYGSPAVATGTFTQTPIVNGTYVNSTHWTYTFLCSNCIQSDGTTFKATDAAPSIGWALNAAAPAQKANAASSVAKHTGQGQVAFDLSKAKNPNFATWKSWAGSKVARGFEA